MSRLVDRGAVFAGWVGVGAAVVVVVAFGLILPIQPVVALLAVPTGALVGWYANARSGRRRPRGRVVGNALWAGLVTALAMAIFYGGIRLIFFYADSGTLPSGQSLDCQPGPDCGYRRHVEAGRGEELTALGITDAAGYERVWLGEMVNSLGTIFVLILAGATAAGVATALGAARSGGEDVDDVGRRVVGGRPTADDDPRAIDHA